MLRAHRQPFVVDIGARTPRHSPVDQNAIEFETEILMLAGSQRVSSLRSRWQAPAQSRQKF